MGEIAFSHSFGNLKTGKSHEAMKTMHDNMIAVGYLMGLPWLFYMANNIPSSFNPMVKFLDYCAQCVEERKSVKPTEPDVFQHLLDGEQFFENAKSEELLLHGDSRLIVIAGSDTTATTMSYILYHLAREPAVVKKLRTELAENELHDAAGITPQMVQKLPYLDAVINESLRLHPPVPGPVPRDTPPEGLQCGKHFIPGNVTILVPTFAIQTHPKAFADPLSFIPERWTTKPELIHHKGGFFPFLLGAYSCIGKQLALMELRTLLAKMVLEFDINFAPGENGQALVEEMKDVFTCALEPINMCFTARGAIRNGST